MSTNKQSRFLLVKHSLGWNVDRCFLWMEKNDVAYDWCYPASAQSFPNVEDYSGVIIFGGAGSANDSEESQWVRDELVFIESCLKHGTPFFGICLGAQMLARVLGSSVSAQQQNQKQIGFHEVRPTANGTEFMPEPLKFMHWNGEGFDLPSDSVHLAYSELFPNQAFKMDDRTFGVQFHPEVNLDALRIWHERNKANLTGVLDDQTRAQHVADAIACEESVTAWLDQFLISWTNLSN